jgi:hypothetical protein
MNTVTTFVTAKKINSWNQKWNFLILGSNDGEPNELLGEMHVDLFVVGFKQNAQGGGISCLVDFLREKA